jgi:hypothetical protein
MSAQRLFQMGWNVFLLCAVVWLLPTSADYAFAASGLILITGGGVAIRSARFDNAQTRTL